MLLRLSRLRFNSFSIIFSLVFGFFGKKNFFASIGLGLILFYNFFNTFAKCQIMRLVSRGKRETESTFGANIFGGFRTGALFALHQSGVRACTA